MFDIVDKRPKKLSKSKHEWYKRNYVLTCTKSREDTTQMYIIVIKVFKNSLALHNFEI